MTATRRPTFDMNVFKERRKKLAAMAPGSAVILTAHPDYVRNNDVHHPYRQDSNFFYLTGFEEQESIFVFRPGQSPESVMFVRPKDADRETWNGFRYGVEGTAKEFNIDKVYLLSEFDRVIRELLKPVDRVYYRWNLNRDFDSKLISVLDQVRLDAGRTGRGVLPVHDAWELLGEMRVIKTEHDIKLMREACRISAEAHIAAMKFGKPGVTERQLYGVLLHSFYMNNADREGYGTIVGSGSAATTLHYTFNDQVCRDGDLVLIDAGAEKEYYGGDITRTWPINGKFTPVQKRMYQAVLDIEKELIATAKPGVVYRSMQERTVEYLTDVMIEFGLLKGTRSQLIDSLAYKKYYPHGVSHYLGLDVHDAGLHVVRGEPRKMEVGMSFTIEPGLYVPINDESAPKEFRGIGIRIEDNVVITPTGCENLTSMCPKEISDLEAIIGRG